MPKVLIVDDSISVRKALERLLAARNMEILVSESGEQAMEVLSQHTPDLMVADVVMPGMSGFDLSRRTKAEPRLASMPVLLISGIVNPEVQNQAADAGALDIIKKPFMPNDVLPLIDKALAGAAERAAANPAAPAVAAPVAPAASAPAAASTSFDAVLKSLLGRSTISGALLMNMRGQALGQAGEAWTDLETLLMYFRFVVSVSTVAGLKLEDGELSHVFLEFEGRHLLLSRLGQGTVLVLRFKDVSALQAIKYLVRTQQKDLVQTPMS
jgi:CheY-like chemotaxis protein